MATRARSDRQKQFLDRANLSNAKRDFEGWYRLSDLGESPSSFMRTEVGKQLLKLGKVEKRFGSLFAEEIVAIGFAVFRDPENLRFLTIVRTPNGNTSTKASDSDSEQQAESEEEDEENLNSVSSKATYTIDDI